MHRSRSPDTSACLRLHFFVILRALHARFFPSIFEAESGRRGPWELGIGLPCWHAWGWQAWHLWHWNGPGGALWAWRLRGSLRGMGHPRRGRRGTHGTGFALVAWLGLAGAAGLCVARVALDDIDIAFVWQAAWAGALANTYFFDFLTPMRFPTRYTGLARSTETLRYR